MENKSKYDPRVSAEDRKTLELIDTELARTDITPERRAELSEFKASIGDSYLDV